MLAFIKFTHNWILKKSAYNETEIQKDLIYNSNTHTGFDQYKNDRTKCFFLSKKIDNRIL